MKIELVTLKGLRGTIIALGRKYSQGLQPCMYDLKTDMQLNRYPERVIYMQPDA